MRLKQTTAVFLSILLAASACVPLNGAGVLAAESVEAVHAADEDTAAETADEAEAAETEAAGPEVADVTGEVEAAAEDIESEAAEEFNEPEAPEEAETEAEAAETEIVETEDAETISADGPAAPPEASPASDESDDSDDSDQSGMMEIIYGDGVTEGAAREPMYAADESVTADDIYSMTIIPTDVTEASEGCILAAVPGEYVSDPDSAIKRINEIRLEACKEGVINPDTGKKLTMADYVPIKWSKDLEYIARIRAAERSPSPRAPIVSFLKMRGAYMPGRQFPTDILPKDRRLTP